jgi:hypothetical protein
MPHIVVGDPNDVTQRTNISMIEGFDQSPSHDIHSSVTLTVSVFQKIPVSGKVSVLLGYVLLLIVHSGKKNWQGSTLCYLTLRIGHGGAGIHHQRPS